MPQGCPGGFVQLTPTLGCLRAAPAPSPCRENQPNLGPFKGPGSSILQGQGTKGQSRWAGAQHSEPKEGCQALPPTFDPPPELPAVDTSTDRQTMANRETANPGSPPRSRGCWVRLAVFPLRTICAGYWEPQLRILIHSHLPDTPSLLSPRCLLPSAPPPGGKTGASQNGRQAGPCLCAHVCAHRHAPSARQLPDPREAPGTWCQSYLGNWPFWFRINRGAKPLGFVKKRTVREMLCHLVRQTFFLSSKIMMGFFFFGFALRINLIGPFLF